MLNNNYPYMSDESLTANLKVLYKSLKKNCKKLAKYQNHNRHLETTIKLIEERLDE